MSDTDTRPPAPTPLEMALTFAARVASIAEYYAERKRLDPGMGDVEARVHGAGRQQFEAAQMAGYMALVSMAEDVHRIAVLAADVADQVTGRG